MSETFRSTWPMSVPAEIVPAAGHAAFPGCMTKHTSCLANRETTNIGVHAEARRRGGDRSNPVSADSASLREPCTLMETRHLGERAARGWVARADNAREI